MNPKLVSLLQRLKEPSTHAGLAVLFALFGAPAGLPDAIAQVAAALLAVAAVVLPESKPQ